MVCYISFRCLKKYCVCYNVGVHCDGRRCQCLDCCNYPGYQEDAEEEEEELYEEEETKVPSFINVPTNTGQLLNNAADSVSGESNGSDEDVALCSDIKVVNWVFVLTTGKEETSKYSPIVRCLHADFDRGF